MRKVKFKSKRQLDARHEADRAVLDFRARRAQELMSGDGEVQLPTPEQIEQFSVGGCDKGCMPPTHCAPPPPPTACRPPSMCRPRPMNDCYHEIASKYGCPMKATSGGQINVDGQSRISFIVQPTQSNFFLPISARLSARSRDDPDQMLVWQLTAVMIKNHPQENYHEPNPGPTTLVGVESVAYDGNTTGEVPGREVAWGPFSRANDTERLELVGWNPYPVGAFMNPRVEIWGYEISQLPAGWECGKHPGCGPSVEYTATTTSSPRPAG